MTFDETRPPTKTLPLVDNDLDEEEAIRATKKKNLENDIEDETLEVDEIVKIEEFRNRPLENVIGNLNQRTLRLVAQGYNQQEGIDYDETYASVARHETIRILLAYACALDFNLFQMDVKSAFLNGFINKEHYALRLWNPKGDSIETVVYADSGYTGDYVGQKSTAVFVRSWDVFLSSCSLKKQIDIAISTTTPKHAIESWHEKCRSSNPSSSSNVLDNPSSSHHIDEDNDGNNEESFHSNTPSATQLANSLSNIIYRDYLSYSALVPRLLREEQTDIVMSMRCCGGLWFGTLVKIMAASAIAISSDSSDESVGSPPSRVILFGDIPTVIPSTFVVAPETSTIAPVISSAAPMVETTLVASPTGLCGLVPYSGSDSDSPDEMSSPEHISPLPAISPFLCTDSSAAPDYSDGPPSHDPYVAIVARWRSRVTARPSSSSEFPITPFTALPGIRRQSAILIRPGEAIPFGRTYRTHLNEPRKLLSARKRVGPLPARRLASRHASPHSSDHRSSSSSLSSDSSPVHSSGLDASDQAHSRPSTRDVSPRLYDPPRRAP
ncbi:putative reverse transcriptase domain-containing protein [Tanacetum coccineum]